MLGDKVSVLDGALVDASGTTGGGTILIGGDTGAFKSQTRQQGVGLDDPIHRRGDLEDST